MRVTALVFAGLLVGCELADEATTSNAVDAAVEDDSPRAFAQSIVQLIADRRIEALANTVHSQRGLSFSPHAYVDLDSLVTLKPSQLVAAWQANTPFVWGHEDASGEPIELPIHDYFSTFLFDYDFTQAEQVKENTAVGQSTTSSNLSDIFPDAQFVEFHYPGDIESHGGMDWQSLRVVLIRGASGNWRLLALINDRWTI